MAVPDYKIELKTTATGGAWVDITQYVEVNWGGADLVGEAALGQSQAGKLSFRVVDKDTDKTTRHWLDTIAQSVLDPQVRVGQEYGDTAPLTFRLLFYGYIEQRLLTMDGDCVSGFSACTLMQRADRLDMHDALGGQAETNYYSGRGEALATLALRKAGCTAGVVDDAVIGDWYRLDENGTPYDDWNHPQSQPSADSVDPTTALGLSDIVPAQVTGANTAGVKAFVLRHGRLYRISGDDCALTEITIGGASITDGYRLFRFLGPDSIECLAIARATVRHSYLRQTGQWGGAPYASAAATLGLTAAAMAIPGAGFSVIAAKIGIMAGASVLAGSIGEVSKTISETANNDSIVALTAVRVVSVGTGLIGSVGADFDSSFSLTNSTEMWFPGDSVCMAPDAPTGIWLTRWDNANRRQDVFLYQYLSGTWPVTHVGATNNAGIPTGGMAASGLAGVVFVGTADGYVLYVRDSGGRYPGGVFLRNRPPSRFIACLTNSIGEIPYANFVYGNGYTVTDPSYPFDITARAIRQQALVAPGPLETIIYGDGWQDNSKILSSNPVVFTREIGGDTYQYALVLRQMRDEDGRDLTWAGAVRIKDEESTLTYTTSLGTTSCDKPVPDSGPAWVPPCPYKLVGDNLRMMILGTWVDRDRVMTDVYATDPWEKFYVHHDFDRDRMTVGECLRSLQTAGFCYLRAFNPDGPADATQVKLVARYQWTPPEVGTVGTDDTEDGPQMVGTEVYDGAAADIGGQRITAGDVAVGRTVYNVSGRWLTAARARLITLAISQLYPRRSAKYANGRRIFTLNTRAIVTSDGGDPPVYTDVPPSYYDLFGRVQFSALTGLDIAAIITSIGATDKCSYPARLLEYWINPADGKGDGVTWDGDAPAEELDTLTLPDAVAIADPTPLTATKILTAWNCTHIISATAQANPMDGPCAYAFPVHLPHGANLSGYEFKFTREGVEADAPFLAHLWTDNGNRPGTPIDGTLGYCWACGGLAARLWHMDLGDYEPDATQRTQLGPGLYQLVVVIDRQDAGPVPMTVPPLTFADGLVVCNDRAYCLNYAELGLPELPTLAPLTEWVTAQEHACRYVPDIQVCSQ